MIKTFPQPCSPAQGACCVSDSSYVSFYICFYICFYILFYKEDNETLEQMLEDFPDIAADASPQPESPEVVKRGEERETKEGGENDERAPDVEGGVEEGGVESSPLCRPAAFGLSAAERNHTAALEAADSASMAIADVREGDLVVVGHRDNQGNRTNRSRRPHRSRQPRAHHAGPSCPPLPPRPHPIPHPPIPTP